MERGRMILPPTQKESIKATDTQDIQDKAKGGVVYLDDEHEADILESLKEINK